MTESPGRYYGPYRGIVVKNNDSETKHPHMGRIRARVDQVYGKDVKDDELPWAWPCFAVGGGRSDGTAYGFFAVPAVGTEVWVEFEQGDPNSPIWIGQCFGEKDGTPELGQECISDMGEPYPKIWCLRFPVPGVEGVWLRLHEKKLELVWEKDKYYLEFNKDQKHVKLWGKDWEVIVGSEDKTLTLKGKDIVIEAQESLTLTGTDIVLDAAATLTGKGATLAKLESDTKIEGYAPEAHGFDTHPTGA